MGRHLRQRVVHDRPGKESQCQKNQQKDNRYIFDNIFSSLGFPELLQFFVFDFQTFGHDFLFTPA
jgi:hypothetical protein